MAWSLGRVTGLNEPNSWAQDGDHITVTGSYKASSLADGQSRRAQLLGLANNADEPIVPSLIAGEPRLDGYYRINSLRLLSDEFFRKQGNITDYQVDMERITAFQAPYVESFLTGALMVNALGITTTAEPFHAYPVSAYEYTNGAAGFTTENRPTADGSTTTVWVRMNPTAAAPVYKALARWASLPGSFYDGACVISNSAPSAHTVVGQQEGPLAANWTLSNGLVFVQMNPSLSILWADSTHTYRTLIGQLDILGAAAGYIYTTNAVNATVKIIRNAPEECILRVPVQPSSGIALGPCYLDVAIRRGSRIVRVYLTSAVSDTWTFGATALNGQASTAITGGNRWTANDANGNRTLVFSSKASTNDLTRGAIFITGATTTFDAGASMELGGSAAVNRDTAASQVLQYLGGAGGSQAERMQVVGR